MGGAGDQSQPSLFLLSAEELHHSTACPPAQGLQPGIQIQRHLGGNMWQACSSARLDSGTSLPGLLGTCPPSRSCDPHGKFLICSRMPMTL